MKLVCFNDDRLGVVKPDGSVCDVTHVAKGLPSHTVEELLEAVISNWKELGPAFGKEAEKGSGQALDSIRLLSSVPSPSKIMCYGLNFLEFGRTPPLDKDIFMKAPSAVLGSGGTVVLPPVDANLFYHEAELGIVIGKPASKLAKGAGMDAIFGYTNFLDVTARGLMPNGRNSFFTGKSWDTFAPMGPFLVTADEVGDPHKLHVKLWVNGVLRQDFPMSDIAYPISELVEYVSQVVTLKVGDVIATGTNHQGLGALQHGDVAEQEINGLGKLRVHVEDPLRRSWPREPYQDLLDNALRFAKR
ncbi:MAG: fumarylacetoacetate hydrolase family protein [Pseudomonadota bacterium]